MAKTYIKEILTIKPAVIKRLFPAEVKALNFELKNAKYEDRKIDLKLVCDKANRVPKLTARPALDGLIAAVKRIQDKLKKLKIPAKAKVKGNRIVWGIPFNKVFELSKTGETFKTTAAYKKFRPHLVGKEKGNLVWVAG